MSNQPATSIKIYKVGGAVRDQLLGLEVLETDWVVVGATPQWMSEQGYKAVGRQFPVFIHPTSKQEYALARTERKSGHGYQGFEFFAAADVTLEQDLLRRDLTINAIAMDGDGQLIDPYNGLQDLQAKLLRHVSTAFVEDPLRVLRVARFYARFAKLGFEIAPETLVLMQQIVASGELRYLSKERIWQECIRAMATDQAWCYLEVLYQCGALQQLVPSIANNIQHCTKLLQSDVLLKQANIRYSCLLAFCFCADIGVDQTDLKAYCVEQKIPKQILLLAQRAMRALALFSSIATIDENLSKAQPIVQLITAIDGWQQTEQNAATLNICATIYNYQQRVNSGQKLADQVLYCAQLAYKIDSQQFTDSGIKGRAIASAIENERIRLIARQLLANQYP